MGDLPGVVPQLQTTTKKKNQKKETKSGEPKKPIVLEAKLLLSFAQTEYQDVQRIFRVINKVKEAVQDNNSDENR